MSVARTQFTHDGLHDWSHANTRLCEHEKSIRLRTTMANERLSCLGILSIEHDVLEEIDFEQLIDNFSSRKARKISTL